jgi:hypothetical protein
MYWLEFLYCYKIISSAAVWLKKILFEKCLLLQNHFLGKLMKTIMRQKFLFEHFVVENLLLLKNHCFGNSVDKKMRNFFMFKKFLCRNFFIVPKSFARKLFG